MQHKKTEGFCGNLQDDLLNQRETVEAPEKEKSKKHLPFSREGGFIAREGKKDGRVSLKKISAIMNHPAPAIAGPPLLGKEGSRIFFL
ncbi:MAG: hypothetical protein ABJ092_04195 [Gillisia sp.]